MNMRIKIVKTKNTIQYSIIKDIKRNGKRTTTTYENIGNYEKLKQRSGNEEPMVWLKKYVDKLNKELKENNLPVIIKKYENRLITKNEDKIFNVGYLFLKDIYYGLKLNSICEEITKKYQFKFDLNSVLSNLIFARIIYPSSKLKTF